MKNKYLPSLKTPILWLALLTIVAFNGCKKDEPEVSAERLVKDYNSEVLQNWNNLYLEVERYAQGLRPCPSPRILAYIGLACYEANVPDMPNYKSLRFNYPGLNVPTRDPLADYHHPTVVNAIYFRMLSEFMDNVTGVPSDRIARLSALYTSMKNDARDEASAESILKSDDYGIRVADAFMAYAKTDRVAHNYHLNPFRNDVSGYKNVALPGRFSPTNSTGPGMFPDFGSARTFVITEGEKLCAPPLPYSESPESQYYVQAAEVFSTTNNPTPDQRWQAFFWSDDLTGLTFSPPARWLAIANQVYDLKDVDLETAIYANAKLGVALNDCVVACWHSKFVYDVQRPVDYIRKMMRSSWQPALYNPQTKITGITPNFPAYPSGHSTMGGAAAEVLTDIFGNYFPMTDRCHEGRQDFEGGKPRQFDSFHDMSAENAYSRIPLGVHFRMDSEEGVRLGIRVGRRVNQVAWKKG